MKWLILTHFLKWQIAESEYHIVIAPYISDKADAVCKEKKIGYVDVAVKKRSQHVQGMRALKVTGGN